MRDSVDEAAIQRQAVFKTLEDARKLVEQQVAEVAKGVGVAVHDADQHFSFARRDAGFQFDEGVSVVERSSYDRARILSEKHDHRVRTLREEADASVAQAKRIFKDSIAKAEQRKLQSFDDAATRLLARIKTAAESCQVAEETIRSVSLEADEYIGTRGPELRKEARASYVHNSPMIEFAESDICKLWEHPELFPDDAFDRILTVNTLVFVPDLIAGLKELRRVLKPTGRMVCVVKCSHVKSGIERGQFGSSSYTSQLPASTELLLQALREAGFGASVRASSSVTEDRHAAAMSLAERTAERRALQSAEEALRCEPPNTVLWKKELAGRTVPELCRIARGEILRGANRVALHLQGIAATDGAAAKTLYCWEAVCSLAKCTTRDYSYVCTRCSWYREPRCQDSFRADGEQSSRGTGETDHQGAQDGSGRELGRAEKVGGRCMGGHASERGDPRDRVRPSGV